MKVLFVDNGTIEAGSTRIHTYNLCHWLQDLGYTAAVNDLDHLNNYDVALFAKSVPANEIRRIRHLKPGLLCGLTNPSDFTESVRAKLPYADFFLVGSIEERNHYLRYNKHVFVLPQIERIFSQRKQHRDTSPIVIGYHGNADHLIQFDPYVKEALEIVAKKYPIQLLVVYNIKRLGRWQYGRPDIPIEEVQWTLDKWEETLLRMDIGIVPGVNPIPHRQRRWLIKLLKLLNRQQPIYENNYLLSFKNTTNVGRALVFHQLGIPVVSDFLPSNFQILANPKCGFLAHYTEAWVDALSTLCSSWVTRQEIADAAFAEFTRLYNPLQWAQRLHDQIYRLWRVHI